MWPSSKLESFIAECFLRGLLLWLWLRNAKGDSNGNGKSAEQKFVLVRSCSGLGSGLDGVRTLFYYGTGLILRCWKRTNKTKRHRGTR